MKEEKFVEVFGEFLTALGHNVEKEVDKSEPDLILGMFDGGIYLDIKVEPQNISYVADCEENARLRREIQEERTRIRNDIFEEYGYRHVVTEGGGEGGTEDVAGVIEFGGKYYSAAWSYYSHEGYSYYGLIDTIGEVKPVEKTVTVYQ